MSIITPHPKVEEWSRELASAIVEDMFGDHARQMVTELDRIKFVCSEYLQQFFDASEHKAIAEISCKMGYDAAKSDAEKAIDTMRVDFWQRWRSAYGEREADQFAHTAGQFAHALNEIRSLKFEKRQIVIEEREVA